MRREGSFRKQVKHSLDESIHAARSLAVPRPGAVSAYDRLLRHVRSRSPLLRPTGRPGDSRNGINAGLLALALHHRDWLRPPEDWHPGAGSEARQFAALAGHLLARYPVPPCLANAWFDLPQHEVLPQHGWYKHVGRGGSLRTAGLPLRVTRATNHWLAEAPHHYAPTAGVRWAQVRGLGGDEPLARAVAATRLGRALENEDFWETVLRFLVRHRTLPVEQVGPVVDFLQQQKFEWRDGVSPDGVFGPQPPPRPDYSVKGRTVASVLRQMEEWHRQLGRDDGRPGRVWRRSAVRGYRRVDGTEAAADMRVWTINELLTTRELRLEGQALRHCVASYVNQCAWGVTSVWSLQVETSRGRRRVLTIEVDPDGRAVRQARGVANRRPRPAELELIEAWAAGEGLRVPEVGRL